MRSHLQQTIALAALVSSVSVAVPCGAQVASAAEKALPKPGATTCAPAPLPSFSPPGVGAPTPGGPSMPPMHLPMAKAIAPADASTSTVIKPDLVAQISCGKVAIRAVNNVV